MALDHATQQLLREFSADPDAVPFSELEPHQARAVSASRSAQFIPGPELHQVQDFRLPVSDGGTMRMRILTPQPDPHAVVVYFHGGGWVIGNIDTYDSMARTLAAESHATVVLAEYRKAPEHPFPIPLEDSWTAYQWVTQNRDTLTAPGSPVFLAGDSAGGNLAAVIARRARDHAGIQPDGQILLYPVVDHDFERDSYLEPENQTLLPVQAMQYFWDHYLPEVTERPHPDASPIHCQDFSKLASTLIITAQHDVLRDEGEHYAEKLSQAGVPVKLVRWPGQMHGFIQMAGVLPASHEATQYIAKHISQHSTIESEF